MKKKERKMFVPADSYRSKSLKHITNKYIHDKKYGDQAGTSRIYKQQSHSCAIFHGLYL